MQRVLASFMVVVFSLLLNSAIVLPHPTTNLPACCRKGGQHKCELMGNAGTASTGRSLSAKCPMQPALCTVLAADQWSPLPAFASLGHYAALRSQPSFYPQAEANLRISDERSRQKRGPPQLLSSTH